MHDKNGSVHAIRRPRSTCPPFHRTCVGSIDHVCLMRIDRLTEKPTWREEKQWKGKTVLAKAKQDVWSLVTSMPPWQNVMDVERVRLGKFTRENGSIF